MALINKVFTQSLLSILLAVALLQVSVQALGGCNKLCPVQSPKGWRVHERDPTLEGPYIMCKYEEEGSDIPDPRSKTCIYENWGGGRISETLTISEDECPKRLDRVCDFGASDNSRDVKVADA